MISQVFGAVGSDRYLSADELRSAVGDHPHAQHAWHVYDALFNRFCETTLDPQFHRPVHPARSVGALASIAGESVLVFGTGPSALDALPALRRMRHRMRLFTSPRGAELLAAHGLVPDLVLVEHRTAIDAHHAARHVRDAGSNPLHQAPLIAAEWRTPRALIDGVRPERLFVPDPLPTWGMWPATAVALAADAGAASIGLLGVDLGSAERPDPAFAALNGLLDVVRRFVPADTIDCGASGARKPGWDVKTLDALALGRVLGPLAIRSRPAPSHDDRFNAACDLRRRLEPVVDRAREILKVGLTVRQGERRHGLEDAVDELLVWCGDRDRRLDLQEGLGLSFLPRLWRIGIDKTLGAALWRPVVLATHELVSQADRLEAMTQRVAA